MTLIACRDCKREISRSAKSCPGCGSPSKRSSLPITLGCVAAALITFGIIGSRARHGAQTDVAVTACLFAQSSVRAMLKTPAAAVFQDCILRRSEYEIRANKDSSTVSVIGYVDSQNSFGALIRSKFVLIAATSGDLDDSSQWRVQELSIQ